MRAMARQHYPWVPGFVVRYPLATDGELPRVQAPIVLFQGDQNEVISHQSTLALKAALNLHDQLFTLLGMNHNGLTDNPTYQQAIRQLLQ